MGKLILVGDGHTDLGVAASFQQLQLPANYNNIGTSNAMPMSIPLPHVDHSHKVVHLLQHTYQAFYGIGDPDQSSWPFELPFSKMFLNDIFRSHTEITEWVEENCRKDVLLRYSLQNELFTFYFFDGAEQIAFSKLVWDKHAARRTCVDLTKERTTATIETWASENLGGEFRIDTSFRQAIIWCQDEEDTVTCRLRWNGPDETAD